MDELVDLVRHIISSIVVDGNAIEITPSERGTFVSIQIKVADEETGKVIGRRGNMANALRTIINGAANKWDSTKRITLEILEPQDVIKTRQASTPTNWNARKVDDA